MGHNYTSTLEKIKIIQKQLTRTITCSSYRAHTVPIFYANKLLNVCDINSYTAGIFIYQFVNGIHNVRNASELYVPYAHLGVRKFSLKISGTKPWNVLPNYTQESSSLDMFKQNLRNHLFDNMILG